MSLINTNYIIFMQVDDPNMYPKSTYQSFGVILMYELNNLGLIWVYDNLFEHNCTGRRLLLLMYNLLLDYALDLRTDHGKVSY